MPTIPEDQPHRVLALDVSSVCVGFAVFDAGELYSSGKYLLKGEDHSERLVDFCEWLTGQLYEWMPHELVVEKVYEGQRRAFAVLVKYFTIVLLVHYVFYGFPLPPAQCLSAQSVKKFLEVEGTGDHYQNKQVMVARVNELFGLALVCSLNKNKSQDDVADAIAVGHTWIMKAVPDEFRRVSTKRHRRSRRTGKTTSNRSRNGFVNRRGMAST